MTTAAGFTAKYYNEKDFTDLKLTRTDEAINFDWGQGSPDTGIDPDTFSVRWTGQIKPKFSETYTFTTRSDDGVKLWVNGEVVIDKLVDQGVTDHTGTIELVADQVYDIRLDYFENGGDAVVELYWESASQAFESVTTVPVDATAPVLVSILRQAPTEATTDADILTFQATFSEEVQGVDKNDFIVTGDSQAAVQTVTQSGTSTYDITIAGGNLDDFNGIVALTLANSGIDITDLAGNILSSAAPNTEAYTLDNTPEETESKDNTDKGNTGNDKDSGGGDINNDNTSKDSIGQLTPLNGTNILEITQLGTTEALSLTIELSKILTVGSIKVFSTDVNGDNRNQIAAFSVVENKNNVLPDFNPTFNLLRSDLTDVTHLQFELEEKGIVSIGSPTVQADGTLSLTFEDGTKLSAALETTAPEPNLLLNDAATIDLTDYTGAVSISGSIHREAALNNVVDLYVTDADGAVFDAMGNKFMPGQDGYRATAIARRLNINLTGTNGQVEAFNATLTGGQYLGIFIAVDGVDPAIATEDELFFSHSSENGGIDHIKTLGDNTFGIEDQVSLGDSDFNDIIVSFSL